MMFIMLYDTAARAQELVDITLRDLHLVNVQSPFVTLTASAKYRFSKAFSYISLKTI